MQTWLRMETVTVVSVSTVRAPNLKLMVVTGSVVVPGKLALSLPQLSLKRNKSDFVVESSLVLSLLFDPHWFPSYIQCCEHFCTLLLTDPFDAL